jgi:hypothetical protein
MSPLWYQGGTHLLTGEGVGGVPIRGDRHCGTLGILYIMYPNKFHIAYWRTEHFGVACLFSSQLPINWALQTGNGNTLK